MATISRWTLSEPVPASSFGPVPGLKLAPSEAIRLSIASAYGRAAMACSWARRSLAAATIFMALVIFCVDWTLRIRSR